MAATAHLCLGPFPTLQPLGALDSLLAADTILSSMSARFAASRVRWQSAENGVGSQQAVYTRASNVANDIVKTIDKATEWTMQ